MRNRYAAVGENAARECARVLAERV